MSAFKLLEDPHFKEALDMMIKQYIDKQFKEDGRDAPIATSWTPLTYQNAELQKAVDRLRKGGEIALYAHDVYKSREAKK